MKADFLDYKNKLLNDGYLIIENLVSTRHLDILYETMAEETQDMIKQEKWSGVGALKGHLQQNPPRHSPFVFRDIVSNPSIIKVTQSILGDKLYNDFYSANTNCPGSIAQPVHSDCSPLWPSNNIVHPPISLIVNIPLVDVDENNGSMEIWPGSHMILGVNKFPSSETLQKRHLIAPPIRANMKKGSVLIRDARTWHRGMPNLANKPRHMIAMVHHIHWHQRGEILAFAKGCEAEILNDQLEHHIYFTEDAIDHSIDPTHGLYAIIDTVISTADVKIT